MTGVPKIDPKLSFNLEKVERAMKEGYRMEANPLGPYFSVRFFNEIESVMLLANREQLTQIHAEIGRALDLAKDRKARRRRQSLR